MDGRRGEDLAKAGAFLSAGEKEGLALEQGKQLLRTKLTIPPVRSTQIARPRRKKRKGSEAEIEIVEG